MADIAIHHGDCLEVMRGMAEASIDAVVTDPPYGLGFMGRLWDHGVPGVPFWSEMLRVLNPGGHIAAFGGTRTYHRMACAIEDAGFEIRDSLSWLYGTGFPKSLDVSKAIDKAAGAERQRVARVRADGKPTGRDGGWKNSGCDVSLATPHPVTDDARQWQGWGTALKPSHEPIVLARKPLAEPTVAANVLAHGTSALNIDGCRVATDEDLNGGTYTGQLRDPGPQRCLENRNRKRGIGEYKQPAGRFPPNLLHDGSPALLEAFGRFGESRSMSGGRAGPIGYHAGGRGADRGDYSDTGTAARFFPALGYGEDELRFFYSGKASRAERGEGNGHPTVKPIALMAWLCRLITPPGGRVLDPFAGSGSTGLAAQREGFDCVLIEREAEYVEIIHARLAAEKSKPAPALLPDLFSEAVVAA